MQAQHTSRLLILNARRRSAPAPQTLRCLPLLLFLALFVQPSVQFGGSPGAVREHRPTAPGRLACALAPPWSGFGMAADGSSTPTRRSARIASRQETPCMMGSDSSGGEVKKLSPLRRAVKSLEEFINAGMEKFVVACPRPIMAFIAHLLFWPTLWWNQLLKKEGKGKGEARNWYDRIGPSVVLGALPYAKLVPKLKEEGVTHVLNMVAEWEGPVKRIPVIDFTPPSLADISHGADFIHNVVSTGGTVYVHCKAGRGRSASVCMAYLIKYQGMSAAEAQRHLTAARPHVLHMLDQRAVIKEFEATCAR